jgi:hypothetical protein
VIDVTIHDEIDDPMRDDQRIAWTVATVLLDIIPAWGDASARYMLEQLPALPGDGPMFRALAAHSEADAREILTTLRAGIDRRAHETPVEALEHARYLLQRGVGLGVLMDAYRLGFSMFREVLAVELKARATSPEQSRRLLDGDRRMGARRRRSLARTRAGRRQAARVHGRDRAGRP